MRDHVTTSQITEAGRATRLRRLGRRMAEAVPPAADLLLGSAVWALAMAASAMLALVLAGWETPGHMRFVMLVYALGGALAYAPGLYAARLLSLGRGREVRLAAGLLAMSVMTTLAIAGVFVLQYRLYYAQWHAEPLSRIWILQFVYTAAAALYQFLVLGVRFLLPVGAAALIFFAVAFAWRGR